MTKQRPILFNATNVRALLDGSKTQTRRVCKSAANLSEVVGIQDPSEPGQRPSYIQGSGWFGDAEGDVQFSCPHGQVGDQLWVRETWGDFMGADHIIYRATNHPSIELIATWKPSIFMPRAASRITLEITSVRVERLQDITRGDCMAEGCPFPNIAHETDPKQWYRDLWETINGDGSWDLNPWVWVIEFKKIPQ